MTLNPLTDRISTIDLPSGRQVTLIEPGKLQRRTWRLTEECFRAYEPVLTTVLSNWPKETIIDVPDTTSPNTFIARLRDARLANNLYRYNSDLADKYASIGRDLAFCYDAPSDKIIARKSRSHNLKSRARTDANLSTGTQIGTLGEKISEVSLADMPSEAEMRAIVLMITTKRLTGPMQFRGVMNEGLRIELEKDHDVVFNFDPQTQITTLI